MKFDPQKKAITWIIFSILIFFLFLEAADLSFEQFKKGSIADNILAIVIVSALCAIGGFIGLLIPHITRLMVGPKHRNLIWISAILGALVLSIADLLCRLIVAPAELPIGILTAILGTPLFLILLIQQKRKING